MTILIKTRNYSFYEHVDGDDNTNDSYNDNDYIERENRERRIESHQRHIGDVKRAEKW